MPPIFSRLSSVGALIFAAVGGAAAHVLSLAIDTAHLYVLTGWFALLLTLTLNLWLKFMDLSSHPALSSREHDRLGEVLSQKLRLFARLMFVYLLLALVTAIAAATGTALESSGGLMTLGVISFGVVVGLSLFLAAYTIRSFRELHDFRWDIEARAKRRREAQDAVEKLEAGPPPDFSKDEHIQGYGEIYRNH